MKLKNHDKNINKRIAILRGINVGGKRKILMADLKKLFNELNYKSVTTYIQSGNVIFDTDNKTRNFEIEDRIEKSIKEYCGFDVPVIVRTEKELYQTIVNSPFVENAEIERLHLTFLKGKPDDEYLEKIREYDFAPDKFEIQENNVFVYCSGKYSDSKLTNKFFESKLKTQATTRNWKTVLKLSELIKTT